MPIRVNLKEIFPSDPQEINVEKLNFNFNKLLELGVGSPGPIGLTGPQGPAGPIGLTGPQGDRGATWWVDAGNPNSIIFSEPLMDGDMYLDQTSTVFEIYQYDSVTDTWNSVVSIAAIVNAYLSTAAPSPFTTGPTGIPESSTKFVVFDTVGLSNSDYILDSSRGVFNASNNKTLFLTNFDENIITPSLPLIWPSDQNSLYNSIFKVVAAHEDSITSGKADFGRYHIELGSLYNDGTNVLLSELKHNLKGKFFKRYLVSPELAATNTWINTAKFSLSSPEPFTTPNIDQNGEFEFVVPKYNDEDPLLPFPIRQEVYVRIGSAEAFEERTNRANILADGISITNEQTSRSMVVGLRDDLSAVLNIPYSTSNFALFDVSDDVDGLFFNKKLVQTGGNFEQIITSEFSILNDAQASFSGGVTGHYMNQGIFIGSNTILVSSGAGNTDLASSYGTITRYDITNPDLPSLFQSFSGDRIITPSVGATSDQHGHKYADGSGIPIEYNIGSIKDICEYGRYFIAILGKSLGSSANFIIGENDSIINNLLPLEYSTFTETENGYRLHVNGKYAWVITNDTVITGPQLSSGSPTYARLTAIDISDPSNPVVVDSYLESQPGTKYLDFKLLDGKAHVLRYTNYVDVSVPANSKHQVDLLTFDILDPTTFSTLTYEQYNFLSGVVTVDFAPIDTQNIEILTVNTTRTEYGSLAIKGKDIYVGWEDNLYIVDFKTSSILKSTTQLSTEVVYVNDIIAKGRYAYVLVNYTDSTGAVQVYDVSDNVSPLLVSETRNASLRNSSRFTINGKNIYVVTTQAGSSSRLLTLDLTGISSPSANIGSLRTDDLHVIGNAHIKNNVQIKNSLNVGPGGIYVDAGEGISVDGKIIASSITSTGHTTIKVTNNSVAQTIASDLLNYYDAEFDTSVYDVLGEFDTTTYKFTAASSGYYLFNFHGSLKHNTIRYALLTGQVRLYDSTANYTELSMVADSSITSESISEYVTSLRRPDMSGSAVLYVAAGDWVKVKYNCYAATASNTPFDMDMYLQELTINKIV